MTITERTKEQARKALALGYVRVEVIKCRNFYSNAIRSMSLEDVLESDLGCKCLQGRGIWYQAKNSSQPMFENSIRYSKMMKL
jgi:hypothetical protein